MNIPFFPNTGDGTHCFQAVLMMALARLMPERKFSYDELDKISEKQPGKWTWPTAAMLWMIKEGLKIKLIEEFDYQAFVDLGEKYLIDRFGEEVGRAQAQHSDVAREIEIARSFIAMAPIEMRIPTIDDIKNELSQDAVVIANINAQTLHDRPGYSGHFVVVCDVEDQTVTLHDPGLPPYPNLKVSTHRFEKAWGYPAERDKNLLSVAAM